MISLSENQSLSDPKVTERGERCSIRTSDHYQHAGRGPVAGGEKTGGFTHT